MSKNIRRWILFNAALLFLFLALWGYSRMALAPSGIAFCLFKKLFHLYCPFCGGTRAFASLCRLDFISALRYNAYLTLFAFFAAFYDLLVFIRLLLRRPRPFFLPKWVWWSLLVLLAVFFALRNLFLCAGFDPAGDLLFFRA